jgi:hypothetical protein
VTEIAKREDASSDLISRRGCVPNWSGRVMERADRRSGAARGGPTGTSLAARHAGEQFLERAF